MSPVKPGHLPLDYAASGPVRWLLQRFHGRDSSLEPWIAALMRPIGFFQWEIQHVLAFPMGNPIAAGTVMKTRSLEEYHG